MAAYYVIGSGGFAKEVYFHAETVLGKAMPFKGFIDYKPSAATTRVRNTECAVIDEDFFLQHVEKTPDTYLYIGVGNPKITEKIIQKFAGYTFPNLIHPSFIGDLNSIKMGVGNIFAAGCISTVDITIGSYNIFNGHCAVGHDTIIGDNNVFNAGSRISGTVVIGSGNLFGVSSTVLQNLTIGDNNVLGAGAVAFKGYGSGMVMIGSPARQLS